jgi:peroxiredoxin
MQAEVYAARSDPQGITRLIYEFKESSSYDGEPFEYSGGVGRDDPLVVTRPHARGSNSLTVTAMEKLRRQAMMGRGQRVPAVSVEAKDGKTYALDALPWKVTLIDFWLGQWTPWRRAVPYMVKCYDEYRRQGFGIIGISLDRGPADGLALLEQYGARWPQALDPQGKTARLFGLFGEAGNILVDENGFVIARNVRAEDLSAVVRGALGLDGEE